VAGANADTHVVIAAFKEGKVIRGVVAEVVAAWADDASFRNGRWAFPDDAHSFHSSSVRLVPVAPEDDRDEEPHGGVMGAPV